MVRDDLIKESLHREAQILPAVAEPVGVAKIDVIRHSAGPLIVNILLLYCDPLA